MLTKKISQKNQWGCDNVCSLQERGDHVTFWSGATFLLPDTDFFGGHHEQSLNVVKEEGILVCPLLRQKNMNKNETVNICKSRNRSSNPQIDSAGEITRLDDDSTGKSEGRHDNQRISLWLSSARRRRLLLRNKKLGTQLSRDCRFIWVGILFHSVLYSPRDDMYAWYTRQWTLLTSSKVGREESWRRALCNHRFQLMSWVGTHAT